MGLFSKERHGAVETVLTGRKFIWRIPNFGDLKVNQVLDSDLLTSFQGVEFHFHLILGLKGDIGFYLHYKKTKIPKYSFYLASGKDATMRQHTAHTIPQDTERCGHWNVASSEQVLAMLPSKDAPLEIVFSFDNDFLEPQSAHEDGARRYNWHIPSPTARCITPLTSNSFTFNGVYYVLRLDKKAGDNQGYVAFVFSRTGLVPPHEISLLDARDRTVVELPRTEDMATQLLHIPQGGLDFEKVVISVTMHRGGNPLDILNNPDAALDGKNATQVHPDDEKAKKYGVAMMDDI